MSSASETTATRITRIAILTILIVFTVLPLLSMITTALQKQGTLPSGLTFPTHPQWQNFVDAWNAADFLSLLKSSTFIELGVTPAAVVFSALAGYGLASTRLPGRSLVYGLFILGLTQMCIRDRLKGIVGVEIIISSVQVKAKWSQNRPGPDIEGVISGLEASGQGDAAAAVREARP